jgi:hypothetical protein
VIYDLMVSILTCPAMSRAVSPLQTRRANVNGLRLMDIGVTRPTIPESILRSANWPRNQLLMRGEQLLLPCISVTNTGSWRLSGRNTRLLTSPVLLSCIREKTASTVSAERPARRPG